MDPKQCILNAIEAYDNGSYNEAKDHLDIYYLAWKLKGGFSPEVMIDGDTIVTLLDNTLDLFLHPKKG